MTLIYKFHIQTIPESFGISSPMKFESPMKFWKPFFFAFHSLLVVHSTGSIQGMFLQTLVPYMERCFTLGSHLSFGLTNVGLEVAHGFNGLKIASQAV